MKIREITPNDLPDITNLLAEGFPRKSFNYWHNALSRLTVRPKLGNLPKFGFTLELDNSLQGVILMITQEMCGDFFCNLSSWYIRPKFRKYAPLLFQRSLRFKGVNYTDCSPAAHILPIIRKFGFQPYTAGTMMLDARAALRPGSAVEPLTQTSLNGFEPELQENITRHLAYGCQGFLLSDRQVGRTPVLFRTTRLKRMVPAARFILGDPRHLITQASGLARVLLRRGIPVMLIDWPEGVPHSDGRLLPQYGLRYYRGEAHPDVGDLRDTEIGIFGL